MGKEENMEELKFAKVGDKPIEIPPEVILKDHISPLEPEPEFVPRLDMDWIWFNQKSIAGERIDIMHIIFQACQKMFAADIVVKQAPHEVEAMKWPETRNGYIYVALSGIPAKNFNYIRQDRLIDRSEK